MRWITVVFALIGALVCGGMGGSLSLEIIETWSFGSPLRLAVLCALYCAGLPAGLWGGILALRGDVRARWVLAVPTVAMVLVALPDPRLTEMSFRLALLLGIASIGGFLMAPRRRPVGAVVLSVLLVVTGMVPNRLRQGFLTAVRQGDLARAEWLLNLGVEVEEVGPDGAMPLILAVEARDPGMVALLLRRRASVHARGREGRSAMMLSIAEGTSETTELLVGAARVDLRRSRSQESSKDCLDK